jgi:hypothetical protein
MNLWTEYEGRTIGGVYPLTKLIRPEGRSAFFMTSNGTGSPTVIRLIESHFDGDDILTRWRGMAALNHPNLVKLKGFGHVVIDETSLVYAVMEPVDSNLAEIVNERSLTVDEARELATSLLGAIGALHANGFVHEHVEAGNVLAVGEMIKLRSDCIRETPEGEDGRQMKRKDVRDFAAVLLEALTQGRKLEGSLPAPFEQIVRKGMSGEWGLSQIEAALEAPARTSAAKVEKVETKEVLVERPAVAPVADPVTAPVVPAPLTARRFRVPVEARSQVMFFGRRWWIYGAAGLLILLLVWYFASGRRAANRDGAAKGASGTASVVPASTPQPAVGPSVSAEAAAPAPINSPTDSGGPRGNWRVIAFTYNRQDQAQQKVTELAQSHPDMELSVFTPTGRAPFLVALGRPMSRQDAFSLSGKAKREGFPRDTYAQNYRGGGN